MSLRPSTSMKCLGLPLVCLAAFSLLGGQWGVAQAVAWGQMLWRYSQEAGSFAAGAERTFSGQYPCDLCGQLATEKQKEHRDPLAAKAEKSPCAIFLAAFPWLVPPPAAGAGISFFPPSIHASARVEGPPEPVPRDVRA